MTDFKKNYLGWESLSGVLEEVDEVSKAKE